METIEIKAGNAGNDRGEKKTGALKCMDATSCYRSSEPIKDTGQTMLKMIRFLNLIRGHPDDGNSEVEGKRAKNGVCPVPPSEVNQKGIIDDSNTHGPLGSPKRDKELSRELLEENQGIEEFIRQVTSLQTERATLQLENSQLESEIQKLQLKLQNQPELQEEDVTQIERKSNEEGAHSVETEKKLPKVCRSLNSTCQISNSTRS